MLVPVACVGGVAMSVVHVVDMVAVLDGLVTASRTVPVRVMLMFDMSLEAALVPVAVVGAMRVAVVEVVGVALVLDGDMSAARGVLMRMSLMGLMGGCHILESSI